LKNIIICKNCEETVQRVKLSGFSAAYCPYCGHKLYSNILNIEYKLFAYSLSSLLFFVIFNIYPIIKMDILGKSSEFLFLDTISALFYKGYPFIGLFTFFTVFLFPLILIGLYLLFAIMLIFNKKSKNILVAITLLREWVFVDIFLVSILVALVKVVKYGYIELEVGFWSLIIFFVLQFIMQISLKIEYLWEIDV